MQNGVIILNSGRSTLINEKALISALELRKIPSVWMDVFPEEPYAGKTNGIYAGIAYAPY